MLVQVTTLIRSNLSFLSISHHSKIEAYRRGGMVIFNLFLLLISHDDKIKALKKMILIRVNQNTITLIIRVRYKKYNSNSHLLMKIALSMM